MSFAQPGLADSQPSPGLSLNLPSNNPFRNRAASPLQSNAPRSPFDAPPRPVSRNPFLDASTQDTSVRSTTSPDKMSFATPVPAPPRTALTSNAAELFDNLTLNDKPPTTRNGMRPPPPRANTGDKPLPPYTSASGSRSENVPPRGPLSHRPSRSQEEAMRARRVQGGSSRPRQAQELDIFADPVESSASKAGARVRRNSDSSVLSHRRPLDTEEDKKRQERRRRERRDRKEREAKDPKSKRPPKNLDIIDKLDVTSIYGTGLFHHDGPFDACNPHRNRQGSRRAPMQAFPKDSLNNALGGGGPVNKRPNHAAFLGHNDEEAFKDYSKGGQGQNGYEPYNNGAIRGPSGAEQNVESATQRVEPIHGEETLGLGTSTFLEGAPASKKALERHENDQTSPTETGGLGRKKSLAQRIRGVNTRRDYGPSGRVTSPEGVYSPEARTPGGSRSETNPFFEEFSRGDDTKKESITIVEPEKIGRARAPSSPRRGFGERLERRVTSDGSGDMPPSTAPKMGGGFLSRVKSLKGGPRKPKIPAAQPSSDYV